MPLLAAIVLIVDPVALFGLVLRVKLMAVAREATEAVSSASVAAERSAKESNTIQYNMQESSCACSRCVTTQASEEVSRQFKSWGGEPAAGRLG